MKIFEPVNLNFVKKVTWIVKDIKKKNRAKSFLRVAEHKPDHPAYRYLSSSSVSIISAEDFYSNVFGFFVCFFFLSKETLAAQTY